MNASKEWHFKSKDEEIVISIGKEQIFEWFRRYGQTQHCPACNARYVAGWEHGHSPACEYIKWLTATYPQYSIKTGKKTEPSKKRFRAQTRRKPYRSEITVRKEEPR